MIITRIYLEKFGFGLPNAAVEIEEITSRKDTSFEDKNDLNLPYKDGYVRVKVWVDEQSFVNGKEPIHVFEEPIQLDYEAREAFHQNVLNQFVLKHQ